MRFSVKASKTGSGQCPLAMDPGKAFLNRVKSVNFFAAPVGSAQPALGVENFPPKYQCFSIFYLQSQRVGSKNTPGQSRVISLFTVGQMYAQSPL